MKRFYQDFKVWISMRGLNSCVLLISKFSWPNLNCEKHCICSDQISKFVNRNLDLISAFNKTPTISYLRIMHLNGDACKVTSHVNTFMYLRNKYLIPLGVTCNSTQCEFLHKFCSLQIPGWANPIWIWFQVGVCYIWHKTWHLLTTRLVQW